MPGGKIEIDVVPQLDKFPRQLESGLRSSTGIATKVGAGISTALGVGLLGAGAALAKVVTLTAGFESSLNSLQAVSGATADQMGQVSAKAQELGADTSLAGTSAATAADAMLELAKGGLTVDQAMQAAKGTLTLAAAAQVDGARAAQIQSDALNIFGLKATEASHVADVLANTANASAVSITDVAESMKFVGPVAKSAGVSIEDTATAIGLLGNNGIRGSEAGTALRGMIAGLVAPSKASAKALGELGVNAFDSSGKFIGFEGVIDQLRVSQGKLTDEQYQGAVATAFGRETMSAVLALVNGAPGSWDKFAASVNKTGGAQEVAAAQMQGLGGAIEGLQSQLETTAIKIGLGLSPALESVTRGATDLLGATTDAAGGVGKLGDRFPGLNRAVEVGKGLLDDFRLVLVNAKGAAEPVIESVERLTKSAASDGGAVSKLATGVDLLGDAASGASQVLGPVGDVLGFVVDVAGHLPGPLQAAALGFLAFKTVPGILSAVRGGSDETAASTGRLRSAIDAVTAPVRGATAGLGQFRGEMQLQRNLADLSGQSIGRLGAAQAAFESSTLRSVSAVRGFRDGVTTMKDAATGAGAPIGSLRAGLQQIAEQSDGIGRMRDSFVKASEGASRFGPAIGVAAAAGSGLKTALGGILSAVGGPWTLAIGAAAAGLTLLGQHQEDAARAAQQNQQRVDQLASSLNKLTGAAQASTRELVGQSLTSVKLADGTTTLGAALTRAGISATDFVDATTGNKGKLDQLNATLFTQAKAALENSTAWKGNSQEFAKAGVSLDLATAAAIGNVQAQDEMQRKLAAVGEGWNGLNGKVSDAIGPLAEVGAQLGLQAGDFAKAAEAQKATAAAAQNFDDVLKTLADNKGFEALKGGGPINDALRKSFDGLTESASRTATEAGKTSAGLYGIDAGAAKARESMQASRDAFVQAAEGALGSKDAAEQLANQLGLIPAQAETKFRLDAGQAAGQLQQIADQLKATPDAKTVTVKALGQDAIAQLNAIGIKTTTLPDGQVKVDLQDQAARAKFDALMATLSTANAAPTLDLNTATAQQKADAMKTYIDGLVGIAKADADAAPGTAKADQLKGHIDAITGIMKADADISPGTAKGDELQRRIDGLVGVMTADANNAPGTAKGDALRAYINKLIGTLTAEANTAPGTAKSNALKAYVDKLRALIGVDANVSSAQGVVDGFIKRNDGRTIRIYTSVLGSGGAASAGRLAQGGIVSAMHDGGVIGMAGGGTLGRRLKLTPMSGKLASIVPPNTWRVVGDRIRDDEAFIPINRSARSQRIFEETARRMGYQAVRMYAEGGVAERTTAAVTAARVSGGSDRAVVAGLGALHAEMAGVRRDLGKVKSVTYSPTFNNIREQAPAQAVASDLRTAAAMGRL